MIYFIFSSVICAVVFWSVIRSPRRKQERPVLYGVVGGISVLVWVFTGAIYTLGHSAFSDLLSYPVYNALSYVISGPFLGLESLLGGHTHYSLYIFLALALGFVTGLLLHTIRVKTAGKDPGRVL